MVLILVILKNLYNTIYNLTGTCSKRFIKLIGYLWNYIIRSSDAFGINFKIRLFISHLSS